MLSPVTRAKLARVLALLGSDKPGERDAAGLAAHRMVSGAGTTWEEVLAPAPLLQREPLHAPWRTMVAACRRRPDALTEWERGFINSISIRNRLTEKQMAVLARLAEKAATGRAA
jgi:hypothetical protein